MSLRALSLSLVLCFGVCVALLPTPSYAAKYPAHSKNDTSPSMAIEPVVMRPPSENLGLSARAVVQAFYDDLQAVMKEADALKFEGRYSRLKNVIARTFNTQEMIHMASGPSWIKTAPEKQDGLAKAFQNFTIANYASQFKSYDGEKFEVLAEKNGGNPNEKIVETTLASGADTHQLSYRMRKGDKGWQIIDVYVNGTISEMATRRSEFGSVLRKNGADALLNLLQEKSKLMGEG